MPLVRVRCRYKDEPPYTRLWPTAVSRAQSKDTMDQQLDMQTASSEDAHADAAVLDALHLDEGGG